MKEALLNPVTGRLEYIGGGQQTGTGTGDGASINDASPSTLTTYSSTKVEALVTDLDARLDILEGTSTARLAQSVNELEAIVDV